MQDDTQVQDGPAADGPRAAHNPTQRAAGLSMPTPPKRIVIRYFGDYMLMGEIASGGMGVVHRARQVSLNRNVAIKMIHPGKLDRPDSLRRFRNEGEAMAALRHEHIVHIHEIGEHEGRHYISMELVEGQSLAEVIEECRTRNAGSGRGEGDSTSPRPSDGRGVRGEGELLSDLPFGTLRWQRAIATLLAKVAHAVRYAHQRGVLHRDLKPSNILVDESGEPHLTDFGLAKLLEKESDQTQSRDVMGTPNYMAPEQAAGKTSEVTTAADIYSLGAILFAALTGRPPFQGETAVEVLRQVTEDEPPRPRALNPQVDRDLETICLKCLEKHPRRRYDSSAVLAEDLERWLTGEPIVARPVGARERMWKWVRRHPATAGLCAALGLSVLLGLSGFTWQWRQKMEAIRLRIEGASSTRILFADLLFRDGDTRTGLRELVHQWRDEPLDSCNAHRLLSALLRRAWPLPQAQFDLRGAVGAVRWHPDGRRMLVVSGSGKDRYQVELSLWDSVSGQRLAGPTPSFSLPGNFDFSPDGRWLLASSGDQLWRLDATTLTNSPASQLVTNLSVADFAWHPDSRRALLAAGHGVALLDVLNPSAPAAITPDPRFPLPANAVTVAVSANGQWFAASDEAGHVRVWEAESGRLVVELPRQPAPVMGIAFAADDRHCLTQLTNQECALWELPAGRAVARFTNATNPNFDPTGEQFIFQQSRDQQSSDVILAGTSNGAILRRWAGMSVGPEQPFSSDRQSLVLFAGDNTPKWLDRVSGGPLGEPLPYALAAELVSFAPDGQTLAVGTAFGDLALWRKPRATLVPAQLVDSNFCFAVSADHAWLAAPTGAVVPLLNSAGDTVRSFVAPGFVAAVDFDRSATNVGVGTDGGELQLWRVAEGTVGLRANLTTNPIAFVRFSPDGRVFAAVTLTGLLQQWDARTGQALTPPLDLFAQHPSQYGGAKPYQLAFCPDGQTLAVACHNGLLQAFASGTTNRRYALPHDDIPVSTAQFSRDGSRLATGAIDGAVRIWDARTGRLIHGNLRHGAVVMSVDFSPDGRRLLTASWDRTARVWDTGNGRLLASAAIQGSVVWDARFSPDGARFATGAGEDGLVRIWDTATALPLDEPLPAPGRCRVAWLGEDSLVAAGKGTPLLRFTVPRPPVPVPPWVPALAEALSGVTTNRSPAPDLLRLRAQILGQRGADFWTEWAKRLFQ